LPRFFWLQYVCLRPGSPALEGLPGQKIAGNMPIHMWHNVRMTNALKVAPRSRAGRSLRLDLESVEAGVPVETMTTFVAMSGVELKDLYDIVIPARTLKHRRSRKQALSPDESDKLARLIRVFDQAVTVLGDRERARNWLNKPKKRFEERTPLQMLRTEVGGRMVEEMLGQIDEGMFA
jgi:putative toxin-antitoxin system antitoxin component (TIGR02293 family)